MADITQTISTFPPAPDSSTDTPTEFNAKADAFVNHQSAVYVGEVNQWTTEANGLKSDMNQVKTDIDTIVASIPDGSIDDVNISPTNVFSNQKTEATYAKKGYIDADTFKGRELDDFRGVSLGSITQDPDLVTEHIILTNHTNTPKGGQFWYITTTFYGVPTVASNKAQIAVSYLNEITSVYSRSVYNGIWTAWTELSSTGGIAQGKNILINPDLTVNQRGITTLPASGEYWYDRWRSTGSQMVQVVEDGSYVPNAVYTYSGVGITTQQITSPTSGDWVTPAVPSTARQLKLELGSEATPFIPRPIGEELVLCQRYFMANPFKQSRTASTSLSTSKIRTFSFYFTPMRVVPTHTYTWSDATGVIIDIQKSYMQGYATAGDETNWATIEILTLDAEIY